MLKNEIQNTPVHNNLPLFIEVSGSHLQMGKQIGEAAREKIQHSVEDTRKLLDMWSPTLKLTWEDAKLEAKKYLPYSEQTYPQYIDEMRGIAEGANLSFEDILIVNTMEEISGDALHVTHCTSMAVNNERTTNGHVYAVHNEDWFYIDEDDTLIISAKPEHEPPFMAMTYGALIPNVGFNAHGIAQLIDSVYPTDIRVGIPRLVVSRAVLSAKRISEGMGYTVTPTRAAGYNHLLVHESGEIHSVETSAKKFEVLYAHDGTMIHTNHYLDPNMKLIERKPEDRLSSRTRYFRALRLLRQTEKHTLESLKAIQQDHVNFPTSICNHNHVSGEFDSEKTINAMVIDLTTHEMHLVWGSPCQNQYHTYHLNA